MARLLRSVRTLRSIGLHAGNAARVWFPISIAAQGRPDLTREVMLERRAAFLSAALSQLTAAG
jgi:hypothetical protein